MSRVCDVCNGLPVCDGLTPHAVIGWTLCRMCGAFMPRGPIMDDKTTTVGPACTNIRCDWVGVPHVHEDDAVYALPPDRPEWAALLIAGLDVEARPDA